MYEYGLTKYGAFVKNPPPQEEYIRLLQNLMARPVLWVSEDTRRAYSAFCMTWVTVAWAMLVGREQRAHDVPSR